MKEKKTHFKLILQIFFFIFIFNSINAKNLDKYYSEDKISDYFSGIVSLDDNDYLEAYKYLKQLKGLEKHHAYYSQNYHYSLIVSERFQEAFNFSKKLEKQGSENFESNLITGVYYLKNKKYELAKKYFKKLNQTKYNTPLQDLISTSAGAWVNFSNIDLQEGLNLINKIPLNFISIKNIQNTLAHCYYDSNSTSLQFKKLTTNKKINFSRYNFFYAKYLVSKGNTNEAKKVINLALEDYPRNLILKQYKVDLISNNLNETNNKFNCRNVSHNIAEIFYIISNALSVQRNYSLSNFFLNLAKYLNSDFISYNTLYAENFYKIGNLEKSNAIYNIISKKGPIYFWHASKEISKILIEEEKNEQALKLLENSYQKIYSPTVYEIYDYAYFLKNNKKFELSLSYYTKLINLIDKKHELYPKATDGRGIVYEQLGKWDKAEKDFLESLSAAPDQPYVINYLAYSWIEKGVNTKKSLEMLKKANKLKKNDGYIIDSLGWAFYKLKRYEEAKKFLQLAVQIMPSDPVVNDHYADSLWMNSQAIQARFFWNHVLSLKKTKKDLKKLVKEKLIFGPKLKL